MPFDKTMFSRQARRRAARQPRIAERLEPNTTNRKVRRAFARSKPPVTALSPTTQGWVAGLLEGKAYVGIGADDRPIVTIEGSPMLLTALRRRVGGFEDRKRWTATGRRAEAILLAQLDNLVTLKKQATFALALQDYRRRTKRKLTRGDMATAMTAVGLG